MKWSGWSPTYRMAKPGAEHPHPERLLAFCERMGLEVGRNYVARTAEMVKRDFPGSADALIPKLRAIYRNSPEK